MKLKMGGKKKAPEPKTEKVEVAQERRKPKRATATGPLFERARRVTEALQTAIDMITAVSNELDTWSAADGNALREVANSPDATIFWDHTMRELGRDVAGTALLKDAAGQAVKLTTQLDWYLWAFSAVAAYDAAKTAALVRKEADKAKADTPAPAKAKVAKKKTTKPGKKGKFKLKK